ncbi:MAG TPA: glycine cleavage system aminomethyltransferase GcvT [Microbacterium sp.]|uniref:glycine cleavage system aminomethyltransferase GcvT n=1 Tax=Microbacterium sp. TaxID=51671 RepID=UPI002B465673|nr:glycine cleavage system aminomethyltransferase GcvT [Microbacterium sp.]HKT56019.1 glycine cleavage system aminomethyltransferase GcvT [Microbacterium sp.]
MSESPASRESAPQPSRYTPLRDRHEALGASFTDFGGWMMPVRYTSDLAEHHAVRQAAGLFDISHMAEFDVTGPEAGAFLDYALAGRLSALAIGKAKYSLVLADDGSIIDDVIVYRLGDDRFLVISNAGNRDAVAAAFTARVSGDVVVEDVSDAYALIAVQGPRAEEIVRATPDLSIPELDDLKYYAWVPGSFGAESVLVARTGYTGEDGFELLVPTAAAGALWDAVLAAGEPFGLVPAGLAARDTLRLEAGMPLYGHELSRDMKPAQAGLGRVVVDAKDAFVGKGRTEPAADAPVLVGLVAEGRRAGRAGYAVTDADGNAVGEVTSGALSPTLGHPIAMAFVQPAFATGDLPLFLDVRGTQIPAAVTALPFYRRSK